MSTWDRMIQHLKDQGVYGYSVKEQHTEGLRFLCAMIDSLQGCRYPDLRPPAILPAEGEATAEFRKRVAATEMAHPEIRTVGDLIRILSKCNPDHPVTIQYEGVAETQIECVEVIPLGKPTGPRVLIVGER